MALSGEDAQVESRPILFQDSRLLAMPQEILDRIVRFTVLISHDHRIY